MDKDLNVLYQSAMGALMQKEAKTHKKFFTQEEFDKNVGNIYSIIGAVRNIENRLIKTE